MIRFHDISARDRELIQRYTLNGTGRNCDLSFANLISWRFLYDTQFAIVDDFLVFRFYTGRHLAYMAPIAKPVIQADGTYRLPEDSSCPATVIRQMRDDAIAMGHPFLLIGCSGSMTDCLEEIMPDTFTVRPERDYFDYIYLREKLATLSGKHLQSKRNHCNKFRALYPDYEYRPLTKSLIPECLRLEEKWRQLTKQDADEEEDAELSEELRAMTRAFVNWDYLDSLGGCLFVDGNLVAFTFGCPITHDTFDVCVEKADTRYEGAFSVINQEFARHLPEQYVYVNREEDLGAEGLRKAKLSYKPAILLEKYSIMEKKPLSLFEDVHRIKAETEQLYAATFDDAEAFRNLYFSKVFTDERNIVCQIDNHVVGALQAIPYPLRQGREEVNAAYIYAVAVDRNYRRQHVGSSLMRQAHHTLYYRDTVFAVLIPAEPWLFDWYATMGYTQVVDAIASPEDVVSMSFADFDRWQRQQPCAVLQTAASFATAQEALRVCHETGSPAAPAMLRVINAHKALQSYAALHPDETLDLRVYNDKDIALNNTYFHIAAGQCRQTDRPLPDARSLTISELALFLFHAYHPVMTLMMN
ncbi:GNAT family N-acetyltransferase [Prevotella sp. AGR2160]|uniref:GNAT family N-acetyltransferase n=1 Tax=Prevotella sp. AGR2160 TaxID=1280674 RepID=UPI00041D62D4|nr:GNAT family N-acetyltransferase [Prevotella sp. AGR2160]